MLEKGGISVETKHIFPIIKRWLYSEREIFLRELISNSCDASTKMKRLVSLGEIDSGSINGEYRIDVKVDEEKNTLTITDNGIGMTAEEVKKYITQIALSGALEFIEKYEQVDDEDGSSKKIDDDTLKNGIIGHFGLGFYSSFMVSDKVDIITKSFDGSKGVFWTCTEAGEFELYEGDCEYSPERAERGTDVILHINEENKEFLKEYRVREILEKYCAFMSVPIYLKDVNKKCEHEDKHDKEGEEHICECNKPINEVEPLWTKNPSSAISGCTKEDYTEFYRKLFKDYKEPLFYIHINADYPLNFKGILYFPKINHQFDSLEGEVKLYYNQVFVADNIKEIVPEYLLMLKGVLDCPELPLNVSRSYLQNSGYVTKISSHIIKKVGDKLSSLFNTERETYEGFWDDIKTFVEYGCIKDRKFYDRLKDIIIYKTTDGAYKTIAEYIENAKEKNSGEIPETLDVYYTNNPSAQAVYVSMHKRAGREILVLENIIETQFISLVEMQYDSKELPKKVKFVRVDSEISDPAESGSLDDNQKDNLVNLFKEIIGENTNIKIEVKELGDDKVPALLTLSEQSRRIADMMRQYRAFDSSIPDVPGANYEESLIINSKNSLIQKLAGNGDKNIAKQIYMLSVIAKRELTAEELESFVDDSVALYEGMLNS